MNKTTKDIMAAIQVDAIEAMKIQELMSNNGFDFSRASEKQFKQAARYAHSQLHGRV